MACALAVATSPAAAAAKSKIGLKANSKISGKIGNKIKRKEKETETEHVSKEPFGNIPQGPLQIIISINQQQLHLYSDGVHVTDTLVATGVVEHPTPMGVFSVIDKERYHESNIYSGAPMPYMQRITWSGVAMHQGVGVGHRASHGCIRMPEAFAARLWVLHSLGARVVIARPELKPEEFADPHLFVHKEPPLPAPTAAIETVQTAQTIDSSQTTDAVAPAMAAMTADGAAKTSDSAPAAKPVATDPAPAKDDKDAAAPAAAAHDIADPPATAVDVKPDAAVSASAELDPPAPQAPTAAFVDEPHAAAAAAQGREPAQSVLPASLQTREPAASPIEGAAKPAIDATLEAVPVPPAKPADLVRGAIGAPIAIFVSRKTSRIYVRQHFSPLFDAAVTVDHPEQPLGTHVFTAMEYLDNGSAFRWNVISLPGEPPKAARTADNEKKGERESERSAKARHKEESDAKLLDPPPPQTPHEALARVEIPQDVIGRISALMVAGSSLVVSDQDLGEETGEGTDFVVVTR